MKKFFNYIRANWVWMLCAIIMITLAIIAIVVICKKEAKNTELQREYNALERDYNNLARKDSILVEDYLALQRIDSICCSANDSLSKALGDLRKKCDSLQLAKRVTIRPVKKQPVTPRRSQPQRQRQYPVLDW